MSGLEMKIKKDGESVNPTVRIVNRSAGQKKRTEIPTQLQEHMTQRAGVSYLPHGLGDVVQQKLGVVRANAMRSGGVQHQADEGGTGKRVAIVQRTADNVVQRSPLGEIWSVINRVLGKLWSGIKGVASEIYHFFVGYAIITPDMKVKILYGELKAGTNRDIIGGHSPSIMFATDYKILEPLVQNPDGTMKIKFRKYLPPDWRESKTKSSTVFPSTWSDEKIIESIKRAGNTDALGERARDGSTVHRDVVDGVEIEVIKRGYNVTSGYPTGGRDGNLPGGFVRR